MFSRQMIPNFVYYLVPSIAILYGFRKYRESKWGKCRNTVRLDGKIAIVTGANCGIGYQVALELLKRGAFVIFACRSLERGKSAIDKIEAENPDLKSVKKKCMHLDLSSIASIEQFASEIKVTHPKVDILINNAGVSHPESTKVFTQDGYEAHFGINHLGHFHLTNLLLDNLRGEEVGRVVVVSSMLHEKGKIDLENLNLERQVDAKRAYPNSKLANMYFCKELARRTKGTGVNVYSVCPGWVLSSLFRHHLKRMMLYFVFVVPAAYLFMRSTKQGAQTIVYCATEPDLVNETGYFYRDCRKFQSKMEFDEVVSQKLWDSTLLMTNVGQE